jgi:uncharacterized protein with ParB-like and HNH nuclease domain
MIEMNAEEARDIKSWSEGWGVLKIKKYRDEGRLDVPDFQRRGVWLPPRKSRLIESILRGIPIPSIYLAEEGEGKYVVIDGQQRIDSITEYLDGDFGLSESGLEILKELKNKRYSNIKGEYRQYADQLHDAKIPVIIIDTHADDEIVYEIFNRLNTGGMKLNAQEIRNCMYHGDYNDLIKKIALDDNFVYLLGSSQENLYRRMNDAEMVLRFFAFRRLGRFRIREYKPPLKRFLNREMEAQRTINDGEKQGFTNIFKESVKLTKEVYGKNAFRKFNKGSENEVDGKWDNKNVNKAIFDVVMCGFAHYVDRGNREDIIQFKDAIREELIYLMAHDKEFIDAIAGPRTYEKDLVRARFKIWFNSLCEIIEKQNNNFSLEFKRQVYDENSDCCICGKSIHDLDDAETHNVDNYWRGEEIPRNARVAHRYCNQELL